MKELSKTPHLDQHSCGAMYPLVHKASAAPGVGGPLWSQRQSSAEQLHDFTIFLRVSLQLWEKTKTSINIGDRLMLQ